jgi:hypothetical protein
MCPFLCWDFDYRLECPVDKIRRTVTIHTSPRLRGHFLDLIACDAVSDVKKLTCRKACRDALENGDYWRDADKGLRA